jgi:protein-tyrosine phosphatase
MPFWIDTSSNLKLAIVPRPRGEDWLQDDIEQLKREGIDIVVSLLTLEESRELGLEQEEDACTAAGIEFKGFPIPDRQTPESVTEFLEFARSVYKEALAGRRVGAHCRACIGRSSVLLATLMRLDGFTSEEAFDRISNARGLSVPDTPEQAVWVARLPL